MTFHCQFGCENCQILLFYKQIGEEYEYLQRLTVDLQSTYSAKMKDSWQILCPFIGKSISIHINPFPHADAFAADDF